MSLKHGDFLSVIMMTSQILEKVRRANDEDQKWHLARTKTVNNGLGLILTSNALCLFIKKRALLIAY